MCAESNSKSKFQVYKTKIFEVQQKKPFIFSENQVHRKFQCFFFCSFFNVTKTLSNMEKLRLKVKNYA